MNFISGQVVKFKISHPSFEKLSTSCIAGYMAPQAVSAYYSSQWIAFIAVRLKLAGVKSYAGMP